MLVRKRVKQLSDALAAKSKMEGELLACSRWLYDTQDELRRLSRTIGHRQEDAHVMLDQAQVGPPFIFLLMLKGGSKAMIWKSYDLFRTQGGS